MNISFYPGPSTVHKEVPIYIQEAYEKGILSVNHRSPAFAEVMKEVLHLLKDKLNIPDGYEVIFTSSATECWEIIAQSLVINKSYHLFNGDFGKKWSEYTQKLKPDAEGYQFDFNDELQVERVEIPADAEIICFTQNETSNGTQVNQQTLFDFRSRFPQKLIAIDATSSMAGIPLEFANADIWFASVQKCFGLPAGLGLMICSPAAIEKAFNMNENLHYNSLLFMLENARNFQTHTTPNVLGIFLLMKTLEASPNILQVDEKLKKRFFDMQSILKDFKGLKNLCNNEKVRSTTVIALQSTQLEISNIKEEAVKNGILLGSGYGSFKKETFRVANFPAIPDNDFRVLNNFLENYNALL